MRPLKNTITKGGFIRLLCVIVLLAQACKTEHKQNSSHLSGVTMGTSYNVKYTGESKLDQSGVDSLLSRISDALSTYDSASYISAIVNNRTPNSYKHLGHEYLKADDAQRFVSMLVLSKAIAAKTGGAFDPSAAPLFNLWGFGENDLTHSDSRDSAIKAHLNHAGMDNYSINDSELNFPEISHLNFNAIAKGYGVDELGIYLESQGITNYMVEIGGEVRCRGTINNKPWRIGINMPESEASAESVFQAIELNDKSVATSGNYRNFYKDQKGNIIGHTIDPRTGYPVISDLKSASIIHSTCAVSDAYATACMVLGKEKCLEIVEADSTLEAILIFDQGDQLEILDTRKKEAL